jgi:hypothetical protein
VSKEWQALAREAGLAGEHIAFGATVLGRANYAEQGYYSQAFFSLSIGFERAGKLVLLLDHAIDNGGTFPDVLTFKKYGHDIGKLLTEVEQIGGKRGITEKRPASPIHAGIVETLRDFATNVTRYYNLELLISGPAANQDDPVGAWYNRVREPVLAAHYSEKRRKKDEAKAQKLDTMTSGFTSVRHTAETGEAITTVYAGAVRTSAAEVAIPWERMYVLQIARFVSRVVDAVTTAAHYAGLPNIPYLHEFFAVFENEDRYFRERKVWSIYP